jgi:hypothetical protein
MAQVATKQVLELEQESFRGMRDSPDPTTALPDLALLLGNLYPQDPALGGGAVGRPGFRLMGTAGLGAGQQLGSGSTRTCQAGDTVLFLNGTEVTFVVVGGLLYTYNWTTATWTNVTLSGAGVALPTSGRVYWVYFNNTIIFQPNDGTTKPFSWDGATTFTSLTNAATAFGWPVVYYARLFFIRWSDRRVIQWSEVMSANTGYAALNYEWTLGQTSQDRLTRLIATNEALIYLRRRSIGAIRGAVTADFEADGVREGISETIGTESPDSVVVREREAVFLDADAKPWRLLFGGGLVPLWKDFRETASRIPKLTLSDAIGADYRAANLVTIAYRALNQTTPATIVCFALSAGDEAAEDTVAGLWRGFALTFLGQMRDAGGVARLFHGTSNGYLYYHGNPDESLWDDENHSADGGTLPIYHELVGTALGYAADVEKRFDRLDCALILGTNLTDVRGGYVGPNGSCPTLLQASVAGGFAYWDVDTWDAASWPEDAVERHVAFGFHAWGRWLRPHLVHQQLGERFAVTHIKVLAVPSGRSPAAY